MAEWLLADLRVEHLEMWEDLSLTVSFLMEAIPDMTVCTHDGAYLSIHSSGDEEESPQVYAQRGGDGPICSDDEFEKEMESEVMDALKLLTSPTALQACSWKASQGGPKGMCVVRP